ncbi:multidrug transporter [Cnuibacter sp. UC19_7]|uniref:multidrug transporter n=1 Tax=Cnuibacter sp. UC19_7 TaxID=3350166 RepID=UPI00366F0DFC
MDSDTDTGSGTDPDFEQKRHDQLTTAPKATEADAEPRIRVSETDHGTKRIDWRDDADVSPSSGDDADYPAER